MSNYTINKNSQVSIVGDSITSGFTGAANAWQVNDNFFPTIYQKFTPIPVTKVSFSTTSGSVAAPSKSPKFTIQGLAGRRIVDISAPGQILTIIPAGTNSVIFELGIGDAIDNNSNPVLTTAVNQILDDLAGVGIKALWIGPFVDGEKWPTGSNGADAAIDRIDALLASLLAARGDGYDYVSWRAVYTANMPTLNPSDASSGVFTSDGLHPTHLYPNGMKLLIDPILAKIHTV